MNQYPDPDYLDSHGPSPLAGMMIMLFFGFLMGIVATLLYQVTFGVSL